jgi:hypothetical protein
VAPMFGGDSRAPRLGTPTHVPLVRPHGECLTGDVFGSQRCDCGPQLREAVERIAAAGGYLLSGQEVRSWFQGTRYPAGSRARPPGTAAPLPVRWCSKPAT